MEDGAELQSVKAVWPYWTGRLGSSAQCREMILAELADHGQCWGHVLGLLLQISSVLCLDAARSGEESPQTFLTHAWKLDKSCCGLFSLEPYRPLTHPLPLSARKEQVLAWSLCQGLVSAMSCFWLAFPSTVQSHAVELYVAGEGLGRLSHNPKCLYPC